MPGEQATVRFTLPANMPLMEGQLFTLRENKITVGTGLITKLHEPFPLPYNSKLAKILILIIFSLISSVGLLTLQLLKYYFPF